MNVSDLNPQNVININTKKIVYFIQRALPDIYLASYLWRLQSVPFESHKYSNVLFVKSSPFKCAVCRPYFCVAYEFQWDAAAGHSFVAIQAELASHISGFFPAKTALLCYTRAAD